MAEVVVNLPEVFGIITLEASQSGLRGLDRIGFHLGRRSYHFTARGSPILLFNAFALPSRRCCWRLSPSALPCFQLAQWATVNHEKFRHPAT